MNALLFPESGDNEDPFEGREPAHETPETGAEETATAAKPKPFKVTSKQTKTPYVFKRIPTREDGAAMFYTSGGTPEDRIDLYHQVLDQVEQKRRQVARLQEAGGFELAGAADPNAVTAFVPIDFIRVNEKWCRSLLIDYAHVAELVVNFNLSSLAKPIVTLRPLWDERGNLEDVAVMTPDGVHRTTSIFEMGGTHIEAAVMIVETEEEEARIYNDQNYNRRAHNKIDVIRGRRASGDAELAAIEAIMEDYGLKFPNTSARVAPPYVRAIQTVQSCYRQYGEDVLRRFFSLVTDPALPLWHMNSVALSSDAVAGICQFIARYEKLGIVHSDLTRNIFQRLSPDMIVAKMPADFKSAEEVNHLLGYEAIRSKLGIPNSEQSRAARVAAGIMKTAHNYCKYEQLRDAAVFHPRIKTALYAFLDARLSKQEANDKIQKCRQAMAKIRRPDIWFDDSPFVR